jgi:hypothetical protein
MKDLIDRLSAKIEGSYLNNADEVQEADEERAEACLAIKSLLEAAADAHTVLKKANNVIVWDVDAPHLGRSFSDDVEAALDKIERVIWGEDRP